MKKSIVYTKTGDKGSTGLIGGTRVSKNSERLEAYGTVDELNSFIGLLHSYEIPDEIKNNLTNIQSKLFSIGSYLATDKSVSDFHLKIKDGNEDIIFLESEMDRMESSLPALKNFILPGGHPAVGYCHVSRSVCRRAERRVIAIAEAYQVEEWIIKYLNRLSEYLFVLSRYLSKYFNVKEIPWDPKL